MGLAASGLPVFLVSFVFAIIATPYYGATGENRWAEQPHLPKWAVPTDEKALLHYFEGLPPDAEGGMPLYAWLGPLLWWFSLFAGLFFLCLCLVVVLRRHWVETERLPFPVAQIPLLLTAESRGSALPPIFPRQGLLGRLQHSVSDHLLQHRFLLRARPAAHTGLFRRRPRNHPGAHPASPGEYSTSQSSASPTWLPPRLLSVSGFSTCWWRWRDPCSRCST